MVPESGARRQVGRGSSRRDRLVDMSQVQDDLEVVTGEAAEWLRANWDPDLTLGEWWERMARSGWSFPTWPVEWYGKGLVPHLAGVVNAVRRDVGVVRPVPVALPPWPPVRRR